MKSSQIILIALSSIFIGVFLDTIVFATPMDPNTVSVCQIPVIAEEAVNNMDTTEVITLVIKGQDEFTLTEEEMELLAKLVHAEAGNQDQVGKRLVVDVVLNRMMDSAFPTTIGGVIYQSGQFTRPSAFYTDSDMQAVIDECEKRIDTEILWFRTGNYHNVGTPAYQHGAHYFSKRG